IYLSLNATFQSSVTKPIAYRKRQLYNLARFAQENAEALAQCLFEDLGKPRQEALCTEINPVVQRALHAAQNLDKWMDHETGRFEVQPFQKNWKVQVEKCPKGVSLIIVPWNYPVILAFLPLIGAIAAGCCSAIKLSEMAPAVASFIAENLTKHLDANAYRVILGGVPEITKVLELKWDHILYTGNSKTARIIAAAAARHLTPLTLELGGKSPVIIDASSTDLEVVARRVLWGKVMNAGQICVSPDYVLLVGGGDVEAKFVTAMKKVYAEFYPQGALAYEGMGDGGYGRIVNKTHFERIRGMMEASQGRVVVRGKVDEERLMIEPCVIVVDQAGKDVLLEEEIFGPILPVVIVGSVDAAIKFVNERPHALTLYLFTETDRFRKTVIDHTMSGQVVVNDTVFHLTCGCFFDNLCSFLRSVSG
ncbi:hypothetical protein CVT24_005043, partial [Panaeolus cyanescens]